MATRKMMSGSDDTHYPMVILRAMFEKGSAIAKGDAVYEVKLGSGRSVRVKSTVEGYATHDPYYAGYILRFPGPLLEVGDTLAENEAEGLKDWETTPPVTEADPADAPKEETAAAAKPTHAATSQRKPTRPPTGGDDADAPSESKNSRGPILAVLGVLAVAAVAVVALVPEVRNTVAGLLPGSNSSPAIAYLTVPREEIGRRGDIAVENGTVYLTAYGDWAGTGQQSPYVMEITRGSNRATDWNYRKSRLASEALLQNIEVDGGKVYQWERFKRFLGESRQFDHVEAEVPGAGRMTTLVHDNSLGFGNRYVAVDVNNGTTVLLQGDIQEQDNASRQRWVEPESLVLTWGDDEDFLKQSFRPFFGIEMPNGSRPDRMFIYGIKHIGGHTRNLDVLVYGAIEGGPLRQGFVMALRYHNGRWAGYVHRIPVSVNGPDGLFLTSSNPVREVYVVNGRLYAVSTFGYPDRSPSGAGLYVSQTPFETNTMSMVALEPMSADPSISAEDRFWFVGSTLMRNDTLVTLSKRSVTDGDTRFVMTARDLGNGSVRETTEWVDPDAKGGISGLARFSRGRALFYQYGYEALDLQLFEIAVQ